MKIGKELFFLKRKNGRGACRRELVNPTGSSFLANRAVAVGEKIEQSRTVDTQFPVASCSLRIMCLHTVHAD
jgi:hypothetical protein